MSRAAQRATTKLQTRLSKGEKRNRKRIAGAELLETSIALFNCPSRRPSEPIPYQDDGFIYNSFCFDGLLLAILDIFVNDALEVINVVNI